MGPKIAITVGPDEADEARWRKYIEAIERAGGRPQLVSRLDDPLGAAALLEQFDGLLIPGGRDLDPETYGGRPHSTVSTNAPERDSLELAAARAANAMRLPALGICRGMQVMNVALGGSLYEDIEDQVERRDDARVRHQQTGHAARNETTHPVDVVPGSAISAIAGGARVDTNSMHHQAARRIPYDLLVTAKSRDGLPEAVEARGDHPFFVGVQWHPEELTADEPSRRLFEAFVRAAAARAARRSRASAPS